jgi:hypothetical protein
MGVRCDTYGGDALIPVPNGNVSLVLSSVLRSGCGVLLKELKVLTPL